MENSEKTLYRLANPEFTFNFGGKDYTIKKANLSKSIQYDLKVSELKNDAAKDKKIVSYCIWLVLKDQNPDLTEEQVLDNTPGDIDVLECLSILGFISPKNMMLARQMEEKIKKTLTIDNSSVTSQIEQDGLQVKS